jgi:hypothetical protein
MNITHFELPSITGKTNSWTKATILFKDVFGLEEVNGVEFNLDPETYGKGVIYIDKLSLIRRI